MLIAILEPKPDFDQLTGEGDSAYRSPTKTKKAAFPRGLFLFKLQVEMTATNPTEKPPHGWGTPRVPSPIDVHVGRRIRSRRRFLGMTQKTLAKALDITFQQLQKYEVGGNRVSASRLSEIAGFLRVPVSFFFSGIDGEKLTPAEQVSRERMERHETFELIQYYYAIPDENVRLQFLQMVKAIATTSSR